MFPHFPFFFNFFWDFFLSPYILSFSGVFSSGALLTNTLGRSLRNGKLYAEFSDVVVVPGFRLRDMIARHDAGPQEESDVESDLTDLSDNNDDLPSAANTSPPSSSLRPSPTPLPPPPKLKTKPQAQRRESAILSAARARWEKAPQPTSPAAHPPPPADPHAAVLSPAQQARKQKQKERSRAARKAKREVLRDIPGMPKAPKAIALIRLRQSSPVPVDFAFSTHPGVASTGWVGLREPETDFEPESREYTFEEAQHIPGMRFVDWNGCVC